FDERLVGGFEDYDMWLRVARSYEFAYVPRFLGVYRRHSTNMSLNQLRMTVAELTVLRKALAADPSLWHLIGKQTVRNRLFRLYSYAAYLFFDKGDFAEARRYYSEALRIRPASSRTWAMWLVMWLPPYVIRLLRAMKQRALTSRTSPAR